MTDKTPRAERRTEEARHRDTTRWARYVKRLKVAEGFISPNVEGHRLISPLQGFGKMWQKTYKMRLEGTSISPEGVIEAWRGRFPEVSGLGRGFRVPPGGLVPGAASLA